MSDEACEDEENSWKGFRQNQEEDRHMRAPTGLIIQEFYLMKIPVQGEWLFTGSVPSYTI